MSRRPPRALLARSVRIAAVLAGFFLLPTWAGVSAPAGSLRLRAEARLAPSGESRSAEPGDGGTIAVPEPSEKATAFYRSGNALWFFRQLWEMLVPAVFLFTRLSAKLRDGASRLSSRPVGAILLVASWSTRLLPVERRSRVQQGAERAVRWFFVIAVYSILFGTVGPAIDLPLAYYAEFARPHAYGLSNQTLGKWTGDEIKGLAIGLCAGVLFLWVPYLLLKKSPRRWWLYTSILTVPFLFFIYMVYPVWIDPLFNTFGPMKNRALEARILDLASRASIEGGRVYEVDKSVDTKTVNAYVTGLLGTKRIVLWDTILAKLGGDEILFVMGHEMGHYVLGHVARGVLFLSALTLVTLWAAHRLASVFLGRFARRIGFEKLDDVASLPLLLLLTAFLGLFVQPAFNAFSRHQEHEADRFGIELTRNNRAAALALVELQFENLGYPRPGLLVKLWRFDHPPIGERVDFLNSYHPWVTGDPGRYSHLFRSSAP